MCDIFNSVKSMYCIRDQFFNPIRDRNDIKADDHFEIHVKLLTKVADNNDESALVFENEIFFTRNMANVNNDELKEFIKTNKTWDMILLHWRDDQVYKEKCPNYEHMYKARARNFTIGHVYIVSSRLLEKIKTLDLDNVESYYYTNEFVKSMSYKDTEPPYHFTIGKINDVSLLTTGEIKYSWNNN
jgi:hypothetical protein